MAEAFTWGGGGTKLTASDRRRRMAEALLKSGADYSPVQHWSQGAARVAQALMGGLMMREGDAAEREQAAKDATIGSALVSQLLGGATAPAATSATADVVAAPAAPSMAGDGSSRTMAMPAVAPEIKDGIVKTASALGIDPVDLATTISYETAGTFDPTKRGPTTQWGQHRGLIQFGEPQAKQHGVDWSDPVASQLGENGAIASYLRTAGVKPGMGLLDIYSAINAGAPGLYNRSDANNGGAPGTVRDKVEKQMAAHRAKAQALFADLPSPNAAPVSAETGQPGFFIPPGEQPAPAMSGRTFGQIANALGTQPLDPVFQAEGVSQPWMGTALPPQPMAPAAPAMVAAPMPPPRPNDLAMPQADLPSAGAQPAMLQVPTASVEDLSNAPGAGAREGIVQALMSQQGQSAPANFTVPPAPVSAAPAAAVGEVAAAPASAPTPAVAQVAQAMSQQPTEILSQALMSQNPAIQKIAAAVLQQRVEAQKPRAPIAVGKDQRLVDPNSGRVILERERTASDVKRSLAPVYAQDAQGNTVLLQPGEDGTAVQTVLPPGVKISAGVDKIDAGTEWLLYDKRTGQMVGRQPKDIAGVERAKVEGKAEGEAVTGLTGAISQAENVLKTIDQVRTHPGRDQFGATGAGSTLPLVGDGLPGTKGRDFVGLVDQLKGQAFLDAFDALRGGGAISEAEGKVATQARARLDRAQSKEGFDAALKDLEEIVRLGISRARQKAGLAVPPSKDGAAPAASDRSALEAEARRRGLIK